MGIHWMSAPITKVIGMGETGADNGPDDVGLGGQAQHREGNKNTPTLLLLEARK